MVLKGEHEIWWLQRSELMFVALNLFFFSWLIFPSAKCTVTAYVIWILQWHTGQGKQKPLNRYRLISYSWSEDFTTVLLSHLLSILFSSAIHVGVTLFVTQQDKLKFWWAVSESRRNLWDRWAHWVWSISGYAWHRVRWPSQILQSSPVPVSMMMSSAVSETGILVCTTHNPV